MDEPMRERDAGGLPPRTNRMDLPEASRDADAIPPAAVEEARRWEDVPMDEPEESTGTPRVTSFAVPRRRVPDAARTRTV